MIARHATRIIWIVVLLLGTTLVFWGLLQDQVELVSEKSFFGRVDASRGSWKNATSSTRLDLHGALTTTNAFITLPDRNTAKYKAPKSKRIWPTKHEHQDRILSQINLVPNNTRYDDAPEEKLILVYGGLPSFVPEGKAKFRIDKCPVQNCRLTQDTSKEQAAHAIVFEGGRFGSPMPDRPANQIWILFLLESPENVADLHSQIDRYNWTATYRLDSTLNTPYERFVSYAHVGDRLPPAKRNYAKGKSKQVAWFVSNCYATNKRSNYAKELQKYIAVDIYGSCGNLTCSRFEKNKCDKLLRSTYKFYLAFENSNCRDYITEKFYWNALYNDVIPVVMGARPEDYNAVAPPGSYIHVDDFESPRHLAEYLHKLDKNDQLYNEYFRWKGTGDFIDTKYWCRLCSMVHEAYSGRAPSMWYHDIAKWWNGPGVCIHPEADERWASWRKHNSSNDDKVVFAADTLQIVHR